MDSIKKYSLGNMPSILSGVDGFSVANNMDYNREEVKNVINNG